jgi:hypothetical protein
MVTALKQPSPTTSWTKKIDKLIWRGGPNDGCYTPLTVGHFPRGRLVTISKKFPGLIDASSNNYPQTFVKHRAFSERNLHDELHSPQRWPNIRAEFK